MRSCGGLRVCFRVRCAGCLPGRSVPRPWRIRGVPVLATDVRATFPAATCRYGTLTCPGCGGDPPVPPPAREQRNLSWTRGTSSRTPAGIPYRAHACAAPPALAWLPSRPARWPVRCWPAAGLCGHRQPPRRRGDQLQLHHPGRPGRPDVQPAPRDQQAQRDLRVLRLRRPRPPEQGLPAATPLRPGQLRQRELPRVGADPGDRAERQPRHGRVLGERRTTPTTASSSGTGSSPPTTTRRPRTSRASVNQLLGINNAGIAVGFYNDANGNAHAYKLNQATGQFTKLTVPGTAVTATGINNSR